MKNVKFLKSLIALSCVFTLGLGVIPGCKKEPECEHVYNLVETVESTCAQHGKQTFSCSICGATKEEELPLDETAHVFNEDWVKKLPTEEKEGLAVKTCANNPEHKVEVTLPKLTLTGRGYDAKEFITVPTTVTEGEIKLTLKNEYGDISFNAPLAVRKLNNLDDAVILASSLQKNVGYVNGYFKQAADGVENKFSYYFGDDFTRIDDIGDGKTYFYSYDEDGKIFAMSDAYVEPKAGENYYTNSYYYGANGGKNGTVVTNIDEGCINGFHYNSSVSISSFYGAEQGLARLYETAINGLEDGTTVNFQSIRTVKPEDDGTLEGIWFSYSYDSGDWFTRFYVEFSTYNDGTLKELLVSTEVIRSFMMVTDEAGSAVYYKEGDASVTEYGESVGDMIFGFIYPDAPGGGNYYESYELVDSTGKPIVDENGNPIVKYTYEQTDALGRLIYEKHIGSEVEYYVVTYEELKSGGYNPDPVLTKLDGKPEGLEYVYVTDKHGNTVYDEKGEPIKKIMAHGAYLVNERYSDSHEYVSYKTGYFNQTWKQDKNYQSCENKYSSNSRYIQDFEITRATAGSTVVPVDGEKLTLPTNQVVMLYLGNFTPVTASLNTDPVEKIFVEDETGSRIPIIMDFNSSSKYRILGAYSHENKAIRLNSQYAGDVKFIFVTQSGKCEKAVNVTFTKSAPTAGVLYAMAEVYTVSDGAVAYKETVVTVDSPVRLIVGQMLRFKAKANGNEAAYVSTDIYPTSSEGITFTQPEQNNFTDWQLIGTVPGEYTITMPYYDGTVSSETVFTQFKVIVSAEPSVADIICGNTFSGKVLIKGDGIPASQKMTVTFSPEGELAILVAGNDIVYTYTVDEAARAINIEWKSGIDASVSTYDFTFSINEAGDLVVTHGTSYGNNTEDIVLVKVEAE